MTGTTVDVALCQYEFAGVESVDELCMRAADLFDSVGDADLYILPELFGYDLAITKDADQKALSQEDRDELHTFIGAEADRRDAVVVGGSYRVLDDGNLYNRSPIGRPDGSVETYDKCRPVPLERDEQVTPGQSGGPVIEHNGVSVGVLICYDAEFPEVVRDVVDRGAEVIALPSFTATEAGFQRVSRCAAARAIENQAFAIQVPLVGVHPHGEKSGTGRGTVYSPCDDIVGADGTGLMLPRDDHATGRQTLPIGDLRDSRERAAVRPYSDMAEFE